MEICGIIAEYNPFHNGHAHHIEQAKKLGATHIVCVMSGNYTQRGDIAVADKLTRTRMALAGGADLVVELPVVYSLSSAQHFAAGGVETLIGMGCIDTLCFGSECGDIDALKKTAEAIEELEHKRLIDTKDVSFAAARSLALAQNGYTEQAQLLESPNNLLGIEYMLQLRKRYSHIAPRTVKRVGAEHDSFHHTHNVCSATQLRRLLSCTPEVIKEFMPDECVSLLKEQQKIGRAPLFLSGMETAVISRLRMADQSYFAKIAGVGEGLENRIYEAVKSCRTLEEMAAAIKSKRYPLSRIRRILLCAAIGITAKDVAIPPAYIRILGQTEKGFEILRKMRDTARLPVLYKAAQCGRLTGEAARLFKLENAATDLYAMAMNPMDPCGTEWTRNLYSYTKA